MSVSVTLKNVTISYARHPAVHHVSGEFAGGTLAAITGPNGAGKSTLLKAIAGIMQPGSGAIRISGDASCEHIAYLPQSALIQRDFPLCVFDLVATGCWRKVGGFRAITAQMKTEIHAALDEVGLSGCEHHSLARLSAGQFQRALFARVLLQDAPLILLDEPFTAIDGITTLHLLDLIKRWHGEGRTVIAVLHDFDQIRAHFTDCLLLARECVAWGNPAQVLAPETLRHSSFFKEYSVPHSGMLCPQVL